MHQQISRHGAGRGRADIRLPGKCGFEFDFQFPAAEQVLDFKACPAPHGGMQWNYGGIGRHGWTLEYY